MFDAYSKSSVSSQTYSVSENSVPQTSSQESVFYQSCNNASEKTLLDTICLIEFPDPYQENSSQNKTEWLTNNPHGELLQEFHECSHCLMQTTATKSKTLLNVSDFILFQLVIFIVRSGYRCISEIGFKLMYWNRNFEHTFSST